MVAAGYSGTPLVRKIGIQPGHRVRLAHRPNGWDLPDLPEDAVLTDAGADVTVAFYRTLADVAAEAPGLGKDLADHAMLWIAWPRRAAGHHSDITDNAVRELLLPSGLVDVKVAALGENWSGLKFVRRKANRRTG